MPDWINERRVYNGLIALIFFNGRKDRRNFMKGMTYIKKNLLCRIEPMPRDFLYTAISSIKQNPGWLNLIIS
jgi:hypothetical protein